MTIGDFNGPERSGDSVSGIGHPWPRGNLSGDGVPETRVKNELRIYGGEPIPTTNPTITKVLETAWGPIPVCVCGHTISHHVTTREQRGCFPDSDTCTCQAFSSREDPPDLPGVDIGMAAGKFVWMGNGPLGWWRPYWIGATVQQGLLAASVLVIAAAIVGVLAWFLTGGKAIW